MAGTAFASEALNSPVEAATPRVLVVTNDFPPRVGGVQQYVWNLVRHLPEDRVAVLAPNWPGWKGFDTLQPFPIHRWPPSFLWPGADLSRRVRSLVGEHRAQVVLFGHGLPLPLLGPRLKEWGTPYVVLTHGAEVWVARTPLASSAMRWALAQAEEVTAVSRYTARSIRPLLPKEVPLTVLHPSVDPERFSPSVDGGAVRARHRLDDRPVVLCVSRLVPRKGQDVLIGSMSMVRRLIPGAVLLIVGDGPHRGALEAAAADAPRGAIVFAGEVSDEDLPAYYAACDVFAMPCRSRWGGLEVEGFGIVFLEAASAGKAVVAGRSGGAGEAIVDEKTGLLVEGREPKAVALALIRLLLDAEFAQRLGSAGRAHVERGFTWPMRAAQLARILARAAEGRARPDPSSSGGMG
jgi:phosphatidylinositol alpha-1,6-mannosyltransferase